MSRKTGPRKTIICMRTYMRSKNAERRARAKANGICTSCNSDPARPGRTRCQGCTDAHKQYKAA